jgi:hypothetical protein
MVLAIRCGLTRIKRGTTGTLAEQYTANERLWCNRGACNANKTSENRSVRTGQGELENRHDGELFVVLA